MKNCELCKSPAQTYCESDQATLCWDCDAKVHGANFLVSRHCRSLLCSECKSPTPWKASGARLGHTVSVCDGCARGGSEGGEDEGEGSSDDDFDTDAEEEGNEDADEYDEFDDEDDEHQDVHDDEEGDNQVVPGSSTPPPPAASYSSSEDDFSETVTLFSRKRLRENSPDLISLDDRFRSKSAAVDSGEEERELVSFADSIRPVRSRKANRVDGWRRSVGDLSIREGSEPADKAESRWI